MSNTDNPGWTDERVARVLELWRDGNSAKTIAELIGGVTRNAVIAKIHRMGQSGRGGTPQPPARSRPRRTAPKPERNTRLDKNRMEPMAKFESAPIPGEMASDRHAENIYLHEIYKLEEHHCRWPVGHPHEHDFAWCGRTKMPGHTAYCRTHAHRAMRHPEGEAAPVRLAQPLKERA